LGWFALVIKTQRGAVEGVALPEVVGVGFGEGEATFRESSVSGLRRLYLLTARWEVAGAIWSRRRWLVSRIIHKASGIRDLGYFEFKLCHHSVTPSR
jgi:hypothetical protein